MIRAPPTQAVAIVLQGYDVEGGSPIAVALALALAAVSILLSLGIVYRVYAGYRASGSPAQLALAIGLLLLTAVPTTIRFLIPTFTAGMPAVRILSTTASELAGLLAILYSVRGPPARGRRRQRVRVEKQSPVIVTLPFVPLSAHQLGFLAQGLTASVGAYVAWLAYRGYLRNASRPMKFLAIGVCLLTTLPFLVMHGLDLALGATAATVFLAGVASQVAGLASIFYSLTRA